ncbi:MAG TPA: GAP family protein [Gaiellaceae bacterium]|nr:GAP family protein [Gaiellaceae bacterium]
MGDTASRVLLFALVAAASPVALLATLAVLTSRHGRRNGIAYLAGFLAGQTIAFVTAVLVGSAASTDHEENDELAAVLELAFGLLLLVLAWPERRRRSEPAGQGRMKSLIERLRGLRAWTAFAVGILLGVGGVKRLSITIVAGASVGFAGLAPAEEVALGALYVLVAGVLVWAPVGAYLVAGERADRWMLRAEGWLTANGRRLAFFSTAFFGFLLTSDALIRLV